MRKSAIGLALALAALFPMSQARAAEQVMSDGKCWTNTSDANFGWGDCKKLAKRGRTSANGPSRVIGPGGSPAGARTPAVREGGGGGGGERGGGGGKM